MATATAIISKAFRLFDEQTSSKFEESGNRTTALEMLNDGYLEICIETLCSRTSAPLSISSAAREYSFPTGFVAIYEISYPDGNYFLSPCYYKSIAINESSQPEAYYLTPDKIGFSYIPDSAYSLTVDYFTGPTEDLELNDTPSLIPSIWQNRVLPYYVLWKLFAIDKREEVLARAPFWKNIYEEKLFKMKAYYANDGQFAGRLPETEG